MLRKRLITVLTFSDAVLFRTRNFIPDYRYTHQFIDTWSVDEVVILDISRTTRERARFYETVKYLASKCFVPLAVGGKVSTSEEIRKLLQVGADKVVINTAAHENPAFITQASREFGAQCIVGSIDVKAAPHGGYEVYSHNGTVATGKRVEEWARRLEELGAGEICLCSIDRDGSLEGYDNELNRLVSGVISVPLLVSGGAGKWKDFAEAFSVGKADAVCTTNIYHFTESAIVSAKSYLTKQGFEIRG